MLGDDDMWHYKCFSDLLDSDELSLEHLIDYYISCISVFYCINIEQDDVLKNKLDDVKDHINTLIESSR